MRRFVLALLASAALATGAQAASIELQIQQDAGPTTTFAFPGSVGSLPAPVSTANYTVDTFTGATQGALTPPFVLQGNTITISSSGSTDPLHLTVLGLGITGQAGLSALASGFDVTGISANWRITESTDINGTTISTHTFNGPLSNGSDSEFAGFNLPAIYNASLHFDIFSNGVAGDVNAGIALAAAPVPGPIVGAGLPGLLSMLLGGGWLWRRKRQA